MKLCDRHPAQRIEQGRYVSRWRVILRDYKAVGSRVLSTPSLMDVSSLVLPPVNEVTLIRWHKDSTRLHEVRLLLQGHPVPVLPLVASEALLPARQLLADQPQPKIPLVFEEADDTVGRVEDRRLTAEEQNYRSLLAAAAAASSSSAPSTSAGHLDPPVPVVVAAPLVQVSRTTLWRKRQKVLQNFATLL